MDEDIKKFLEHDGINEFKFLANSEIIKNETKEIYKATIRINNQNDISDSATKTIHWMALIYNQPLGYAKWFMTAYPDVVKWFSNLEDREIISIIGNPTPDFMDDNSNFKLLILRKIVDAYKTINNLECC